MGARGDRPPGTRDFLRHGWRRLRPPKKPDPFLRLVAVREVYAAEIPHRTGTARHVTVFEHQHAVGIYPQHSRWNQYFESRRFNAQAAAVIELYCHIRQG